VRAQCEAYRPLSLSFVFELSLTQISQRPEFYHFRMLHRNLRSPCTAPDFQPTCHSLRLTTSEHRVSRHSRTAGVPTMRSKSYDRKPNKSAGSRVPSIGPSSPKNHCCCLVDPDIEKNWSPPTPLLEALPRAEGVADYPAGAWQTGCQEVCYVETKDLRLGIPKSRRSQRKDVE
jgi:hypothetical protein